MDPGELLLGEPRQPKALNLAAWVFRLPSAPM